MAHVLIPLCAVTLLVVCTCRTVDAQLWVNIFNESNNGSELSQLEYSDFSLFSNRYANVGYLQGFLHQPVPRNACSYIDPLPADHNISWFALISDYPSCPEAMLDNVRAAGYKLIITASSDTSNMNVRYSLKESGFPVVIVYESYAELLKTNVSSTSLDNPEMMVEVGASLVLSVFVVVFSFFMCCMCCCLTGSCCCYCKNRRARLREHEDFFQYRDRQYNYEQIQRRERMARQELIESILRQLQELQVDLRTQTPLGAEETRRLPKRPFRSDQSKCDTCAICVEEFVESEMLRWLPCDHCFHPQCIDEWLTNHSSLCPLCKTAVPREERQGGRSVPVQLIPESSSASSSPLTSVNSQYGSF